MKQLQPGVARRVIMDFLKITTHREISNHG